MKLKLTYALLIFFSGYSSHASEPVHVEVPLYDQVDIDELDDNKKEAIIFKKRPFINTYWHPEYVPSIRICKSSGVTEARLNKALDYWRRLGYSFGQIITDEGSIICANGGARGEITILLVTNDLPLEGNLALTKTHFYKESKEIIKSQIFIHSFAAKKERVLEHEIGHALGWSHFNRRYHLMHHDYRSGGYDSHGLTKREYDSQILNLAGE